jgi:multiple sugar transport system permease protein
MAMAQLSSGPPPAVAAPGTGRTAARRRPLAALGAGRRRANWTPYLFLGVPLLLYAVWVIGPMFYSFWMSLTETDGLTYSEFVGLANFERLVDDPVFWTSFWNNVKWLLIFITVPTVCGLGLALLLNQDLPGTRLFKAAIFSPMVLSTAVIAAVWSWVYFPQDGLINAVLDLLGYGGERIGWLADPDLAIYSIIGAATWRQIGYVMLIYLAGLKNVDRSLVEAARTDGATAFQSFRDVVFPLLQPVTVIVVVISIIDALRAFDLVQIMTRGGPYSQSNVLGYLMYEEAFDNYNMGYGAAIAVVLMLISMVFIFTYLRRMLRDELEY